MKKLALYLMIVAPLSIIPGRLAAQEAEVFPAPSGNEQTTVTVYPNNTTITQPGADAGTTNGNSVDFDTPGAVPDGSPYTANPDNTTIIYDTE